MSMILVIQPHKMLQHAMALSLFPQYQTRMTDVVPALGEIKDVDAVVVDAASLRETHRLTAETVVSLQNWAVPMVWIDSAGSTLVPKREKLVVIERPIARQSLEKAVAECLGESPKDNIPVREEQESSTDHAAAREKIAQADVIELVEVVQEAPKGKQV